MAVLFGSFFLSTQVFRKTMSLASDVPEEYSETNLMPPECPHGPTILFQSGEPKYFYYACSASRDNQFCSFKLSLQKWKRLTMTKRETWNKCKNRKQNEFSYFLDNPDILSGYCRTCCRILTSQKLMPCYKGISSQHFESNHQNCDDQLELSDNLKQLFKMPTRLLKPKTKNENLAQYYFSAETIRFVIERIINKFKMTKILCFGCPTIHEIIQNANISSMLLDIDPRYRQFYSRKHFVQFNMFNYYFFDSDGEDCLKNFLHNSKQILILIDPPFGGLIECLAKSIDKIRTKFLSSNQHKVSIVLFFPYFNEHWICRVFNIKITDFIVTYENHLKYQQQTKLKQISSPIRIFTDLNLDNFADFNPKLYRWCGQCHRTVFFNNSHCNICLECPARDAKKTLRHCVDCNRCVKITWSHCFTCKKCHFLNKCLK